MSIQGFLQHYGYTDRELPDIAGTFKGRRLIICADAACVWDDLERLGCANWGNERARGTVEPGENTDFMTVNALVSVFPGEIEHAYSNEPKVLDRFIAARRQEYRREFNREVPTHTHSCSRGARWHWKLGGHGTSGLGATIVGVLLGYSPVILAGMPLDDGPHNGEPPWRTCRFTREAASATGPGPIKDPNAHHKNINSHWKVAKTELFEGIVFSMSGRTRSWFGEPPDLPKRGSW